MTTIAVDGLSEEDFRRAIEIRLREDRPGVAVERLRRLLAPFAGPNGILPSRFLTVSSADLTLTGWEGLDAALGRHDRPDHPITALGIAFGWPGDDVPEPDAAGRLHPYIETSYFTDEAFPFSQSGRDDLLEGYSFHGCTWAGDAQATDTALALEGIDDLCGALAALEAHLLASDEPDDDGIRAGSLGACLISVLLFEAVGAKVAAAGLPRALCVTAGSNGVYPYFDAPVAGIPEALRQAAEADAQSTAHAIPGPRYSSLLMTGIPRAKKRAVLVLEESEEELVARLAKLRGLNHGASEVVEDEPEPAVIAALGSPLMTRKPGGHTWDFRDMLSPETPPEEALADEPSEDDPDDWPEPLPELPRFEPVAPKAFLAEPSEPECDPTPPPPFEPVDRAEPLPAPAGRPEPEPLPLPLPFAAPEPDTAPGFTLLEPELQERLQALLTAYEPPAVKSPAVMPEPEAPQLPAAEESIAYWPSGTGWIEEDEPDPAPLAPVRPAVTPAPHSLRDRLRAWWRGTR